MSTKGSNTFQLLCPHCKSHTPCIKQVFNTIVCTICNKIISSDRGIGTVK